MGDETPANPPAPAPAGVLKKKKDEKYRKRDPRSWENIMRTTANMSLEERQQYLENVYNELYNENRVSYANLQAREKQYTQCLREHEKDRAELTKSILARGQLESLCRELQKQNKLIKEENVARIKEEEDRRREVANTFNERLNALTSLITESKDKSNKVNEENQNMTQKLTELYEQYQQRENHLETVTRQLDLQKKLAETQAKKVEIEHEAEKHTLLAQKKALELQLEQYEKEFVLYQEKNRSLEAQVDLYKSQYTDFETTMSKSNKVFDTFKEEMSKMSKQLHALEAERNDLRKRWQSSVNSLIVLSEQHMALSSEQSALEKRLQTFQKLCRQLQEDRSAFLKQLKENNIEPIVPSLKNGDGKTNENEDQEAEASKTESRVLKLKEDIDKAKKAALGKFPVKNENEEQTDKASTNESRILKLKEDLDNVKEAVLEGSEDEVLATSDGGVTEEISGPVHCISKASDSTNACLLEVQSEHDFVDPQQVKPKSSDFSEKPSYPDLSSEVEIGVNGLEISKTLTSASLSFKQIPNYLDSSSSDSTITTASNTTLESVEPSPRDNCSPSER